MILTHCPVCAAQLPSTSAKQCSRCKTRYCGRACQEHHWKEGGHDKLCKMIKKAGGAEQYNANKKYTAAVAVAAEACAEDTKGQTCYICTQALHWKTKEGLVRGCSCRGTAGFAHGSCLAEEAKILVAEGEENNLGQKVLTERWARWFSCSMCKQEYHGVVRCALGWACWKTYLGRPEVETARQLAIGVLGNSLSEAGHREEALTVVEAELSMNRRVGASEREMLATQSNLASSYGELGRLEEALEMYRDVYFRTLKLLGEEHKDTLLEANNYAHCLLSLRRFDQARPLLLKTLAVAQRALDNGYETTLRLSWHYARALYENTSATLDELREGVTTLEETTQTARRVLGGAHPLTESIELSLRDSRAALAAREAPARLGALAL